VRDIERWNTRSGTVKINLAVDRLPEFSSKPGFDPEVHGGTIVLARSLDEVEGAFQEAVGGHAATRPFADICIPSVFDDSLAPEGHHIVSLFTQWVPHEWPGKPMPAELDAYADRVLATVEEVAPGFTSSIVHRTVISPLSRWTRVRADRRQHIFHGDCRPIKLFHMRPAPGFCGLPHADRGAVPGGLRNPWRWGWAGIPAMNVVKPDRARRAREALASRGRAASR
jgi:phytoene dehydrogenase-like protein